MTTAFQDMVVDVAGHLPGCPDFTIQQAFKNMISELCSRGRVWRADLTPTNMSVGVYSYTPTSPVAYGEVISIRSASTMIGTTKRDLKFREREVLMGMYPYWPEDSAGTPLVFTKAGLSAIMVAPVPETAGTLKTYGDLRPTAAATVWESDLYQEHKKALFHGVLHTLMLMPGRPWTSEKMATYHGKEWNYHLNSARIRADGDYNSGSRMVQMRPLA